MLTPFLHQHQPSRESRFWGKVGDRWTKRTLIMLNFLLKTRQKTIVRMHAFEQRYGKHLRLRLPARAVAGHAAHGQQRQHHRNAEVIYHRQPSFQLVENARNDFCLVASFRNNYVLRQTNGGRISVFIMSFLYNNRKVFCLHGLVNRDFYVNLSRTSYMKRALLSAFAT